MEGNVRGEEGLGLANTSTSRSGVVAALLLVDTLSDDFRTRRRRRGAVTGTSILWFDSTTSQAGSLALGPAEVFFASPEGEVEPEVLLLDERSRRERVGCDSTRASSLTSV